MSDDIHHLPPYSLWCLHKALFCLITGPAHIKEVVSREVTAVAKHRAVHHWFYKAQPASVLHVATFSK